MVEPRSGITTLAAEETGERDEGTRRRGLMDAISTYFATGVSFVTPEEPLEHRLQQEEGGIV